LGLGNPLRAAASVWEHVGKDCGTPFTSRIDELVDRNRFWWQSRLEKEKCLGHGYEKPQLGALGFSRNPGKGHAVKNLAEALQAEAVMYKLSLGWEVKTEIPVNMLG
jgi:hypothetical protein